jgi:hypothetical protein
MPILLVLCALCVLKAQTVPIPAVATNAPAAKSGRPAARAAAPSRASLPGKGLSQHPFVYCGEWDTRKQVQTIFIVREGKVVWTYSLPNHDERGELNEFDDVHLLSNGHVLFARKTGASEVTPDKKIVWNYDAPKGTEVHSAQPIGTNKVLLMQNGTPAKLMLMNKTGNRIEMEHVVPTKSPDNPKSVHGQFRHARLTRAGTYLIPHLDMGKVVEYDQAWNEIWSCPAPSAWAAVRLTNGNTLISGNQHGYVREVNVKGEILWEINKDDLPFPLYTVQEVNRLANGNTVICNWGGSIRKEDWEKVVQIIEVTPDKKVVWALHQWADPDLGPASCIQLLDEPGRAEERELMR